MFRRCRLSDISWSSCCSNSETRTDYESAEDEHTHVHGRGLQDCADERDYTGPEDGFSSAAPVNEETGWEGGDSS